MVTQDVELMRDVRAAGGVVMRPGADGPETLVVHRPAYDDWTLPKGKCEPGETDEACALREVEEETGLRCSLGRELPSVSYMDGRGRSKKVRYWLMEPIDGEFVPHDEVDETRWLSLAAADDLLTYNRDRELLRTAGGGWGSGTAGR